MLFKGLARAVRDLSATGPCFTLWPIRFKTMPNALWWTHPVTAADVLPFCGYPKTYSPAYEALLAERFQRLLDDPHAPIHRFLDQKKARRFLSQPKDYGKPWFGQLMAGPQMLAYFLQINHWMEFYCVG